jgi:hypothetical protein
MQCRQGLGLSRVALIPKVLRPQLDWRAVWGTRASALPGVPGARQHAAFDYAFFGEDPFERG